MKYFKISELQLNDITDLLERGYHTAYTEDSGDYLTVCLSDDNGKMKDEEITDRFFDLEYSKYNELIGRLNALEREANERIDEIPEEFESLEDSENWNYYRGVLETVKNIKTLLGV